MMAVVEFVTVSVVSFPETTESGRNQVAVGKEEFPDVISVTVQVRFSSVLPASTGLDSDTSVSTISGTGVV